MGFPSGYHQKPSRICFHFLYHQPTVQLSQNHTSCQASIFSCLQQDSTLGLSVWCLSTPDSLWGLPSTHFFQAVAFPYLWLPDFRHLQKCPAKRSHRIRKKLIKLQLTFAFDYLICIVFKLFLNSSEGSSGKFL